MSEEELVEALGVGDIARTFARDPNATIEPNRSADATGLAALRELAAESSGRTLSRGLELKDTLGEGGMGVVRLALQRSLSREVAVKTLKSPLAGETATLRLLREAWVTGSLEHPNIVPVYDLALDEGGSPIIVLRRIEGVSWDRLMHSPEEIARRFGATDPLEWNLGILIKVASAVGLAHSRGIVHRDLKPDNVMVGAFGEVYVVDWGVAASLERDPEGRLPSSTSDVAGTPAYMAPEMFGAIEQAVSEASDVYLLGGILHEILTGRPPHDAADLRGMLLSSLRAEFAFPETAPRALTEIATRALAPDPAARFSSAVELQKRLEWFLRHRGSLALSAEADASAAALEHAADAKDDARVHRLFAECRFGYRAALRASADNDAAARGLRSVTERVVRFDLERGAPQSAAAALAELDRPPAELSRLVDAALRAKEAEDVRFEVLRRDVDDSIGRRTRIAVVALLGVIWSIGPWFAAALEARFAAEPPDAQHAVQIGWSLAIAALSMIVAYWARGSMLRTAFNRRILATVFVVFAAQLALQVGAHLMHLPTEASIVLYVLVWFVIAAEASVSIDRRFFLVALTYLVAFVVISAAPAYKWPIISLSNALLAVTLGLAWRSTRE